MRTPNEDVWPGVSDLPDFKPMFPNWTKNALESQVKGISASGLKLLFAMLVYNPADRITAEDAVNHSYFSDMDPNKIPFDYDAIDGASDSSSLSEL